MVLLGGVACAGHVRIKCVASVFAAMLHMHGMLFNMMYQCTLVHHYATTTPINTSKATVQAAATAAKELVCKGNATEARRSLTQCTQRCMG